ncbi:MAG: DUF4386 domain-containing protein [Chloroflexi bacterium]|nr:DUF4386 domain-containing protein [Chloroflexota bacterium]
MTNERKIAIAVGSFFLIAMVGSIAGGVMINEILVAPKVLEAAAEQRGLLILGVWLELSNALSVAGIGILMFPMLRRYDENLARGYMGLRILEAVWTTIIVVGPLALITLSQQAAGASGAELAALEGAAALAIAQRGAVASLLVLLFFSLGAMLLYYALYQTRLLPRFISIWGMAGVAMVVALNALGLEVSIPVHLIFAMAIIANEIFMGIWLIAKGFNLEPSTSESLQVAPA